MNCKICNHNTTFILRTTLLKKYNVEYYKCDNCSFIQTENPYWLEEAYSSAIASADIGLIHRNLQIAPKLETIINLFFDASKKFVDYGGGYGMLVRMMRDKGFDFYRQDIYCENLFAQSFDIEDTVVKGKFELLTAFEVFEHLVDPMQEIEKMVLLSDHILFSTGVQPTENVTPENWWYFVPQTGQHVSLYSKKSLAYIANKYDLNFYEVSVDLFLFSKKRIDITKINQVERSRFKRWWYNRFEKAKLTSLLNSDFQKMLEK